MLDTSSILRDLAARIRAEHDAAEAAKGAAAVAARQGIEHALAAGSLLLEAKAQVPHGQWLPWLAENCPTVSPRMAQYYMGLARKRPELESKCETVSHLTLREAVQLLDNDDGGEDESGSRGTSDEWFTPAPVLAVARDVLGHFDLDPASCAEAQRNVQAGRYFSLADDGLEQEWRGRIWLNPPYSQPLLDQFVTKLIDEVKGQRVTEAILLMANKPITTWYKALRACSAQCLWNGRIMFEHLSGSTQSAQYGSAVFYFGDRVEEFARRFAEFGQVVRPDRGLALDDETDDDDTSRDENDDDDEADDSDEWYTPANILDAVRDVLGTIDLDPASCIEAQATVQASRYFTKQDDGLAQEWRGRVWLNPPFSQAKAGWFVKKLCSEVKSGYVSEAILLVNMLPPECFQEVIEGCSAVCFPRDRIRFKHQTGKVQNNRYNLGIFYFGPDVEKFQQRFAEFGLVLLPNLRPDSAPPNDKAGHNGHSDEWFTPSEYIKVVRDLFGGVIDLDPASCDEAQQTVQAKRYYTKDDDGLKLPWSGRVFLNPPYSSPTPFVDRLIEHHEVGDVPEAILLVNADSSAKWFHRALRACSAMCFSSSRIKFNHAITGEGGCPKRGSLFMYFGDDVERFRRIFVVVGTVVIVRAAPDNSDPSNRMTVIVELVPRRTHAV